MCGSGIEGIREVVVIEGRRACCVVTPFLGGSDGDCNRGKKKKKRRSGTRIDGRDALWANEKLLLKWC